MLNPDIKFAKSQGIDRPILTVYLAGRISGDCINKCLEWRKKIVSHYKNYKPILESPINNANEETNSKIIGYKSYPIAFLDALNSKESDSIDEKGLTSRIPPNLIYDKDILSVEHADAVVANMEDYFEEDIKDFLGVKGEHNCMEGEICDVLPDENGQLYFNNEPADFKKGFYKLQDKILNRRENLGTPMELSIALYLRKPTILIVPERRRQIFEKHPFTRRASVIVTSVEELLEKKWLQILYKSIAGSTGEY